MNVIEIGNAVRDMNRRDLDLIRNIIEEQLAILRKQDAATLVKSVALGTYASYFDGTSEIFGEVVALNKKYVVLEVSEGTRMRKKLIGWEEIEKSYRTRPEVLEEHRGKGLKQPSKRQTGQA